MRKTGQRRIATVKCGEKPRVCASCGDVAAYHVTFEDTWGKLIVVLCEHCSDKPYELLRLQSRLKWPICE